MWKVLKYVLFGGEPPFAPSRPQPQPPSFDVFSPAAWDSFWETRLAAFSPPIELSHYVEPVRAALPRMRTQNARTVLSVGCGVALDVRAFAAAGFAVTALDVSAVAIRYARTTELTSKSTPHYLDRSDLCSGGSLEFVLADLFDTAQCPGPYDVVICRNTLQYFQYAGRLRAALNAVVGRLAPAGFLFIGTHGAIPAFDAIDDLLIESGFRLVRGWDVQPADLFPKRPAERVAWHMCGTG